MNQPHQWIVLVTAIALVVYVIVGRTQRDAPPPFDWVIVFLPALWMFAIYWPQIFAVALAVVWCAGRVMTGRTGRIVEGGAALSLLAGAVIGAFRAMAATGGV